MQATPYRNVNIVTRVLTHAHKCCVIIMHRLCVIGCGAIAKIHMKALKSLNAATVKVVGLVDPIRESAVTLKDQLAHHGGDECQVCNSI